jgi:multidrug efflux pump subunit AcrB
VFKPFEERDAQGLTTDVILASINKRLAAIDGAFVITILPPPINGIGNAGGFKMMLEDKKNLGPDALEAAAQELAAAANADPRLATGRALAQAVMPRLSRARAAILACNGPGASAGRPKGLQQRVVS